MLITLCCGNLPSGVQKTLLGTALGLLGLLLLLDLGGLRLDLTGTREGSVNLTHVEICVLSGGCSSATSRRGKSQIIVGKYSDGRCS